MRRLEYGGYMELETFHHKLLHEEAVALNCGRNALVYLCEAKGIKKVYLPYFLCSSVSGALSRAGVDCSFYHIDDQFFPVFEGCAGDREWLYIVNYYGQLSNNQLEALREKYKRIIIDNTQSYFQTPISNVDTIYSCRKYFGVADGAFLYTDTFLKRKLSIDESFQRMHFIMGRYERNANEFYNEYVVNNKLFSEEPLKIMSRLTKNLLRGINYEKVSEVRTDNFFCLHKRLEKINQLHLNIPNGAFMYPLLIKDGSRIRKELQNKKIYIPTLWPNVLYENVKESKEYKFASDILPIPVDHRYTVEDMSFLAKEIVQCIG